MLYLIAKALHIVGLVSWMGSLLYLGRLCVYHAEAGGQSNYDRDLLRRQYQLMQSRLWRIITRPAMWMTVAAGVLMGTQLQTIEMWLVGKMVLIAFLLAYHHQCGEIVAAQARDESTWTSLQLRFWNELGTLLLVAIVSVAVFKQSMTLLGGIIGLVLVALVLVAGVRVYHRYRMYLRN
jgi:putative membrane protein